MRTLLRSLTGTIILTLLVCAVAIGAEPVTPDGDQPVVVSGTLECLADTPPAGDLGRSLTSTSTPLGGQRPSSRGRGRLHRHLASLRRPRPRTAAVADDARRCRSTPSSTKVAAGCARRPASIRRLRPGSDGDARLRWPGRVRRPDGVPPGRLEPGAVRRSAGSSSRVTNRPTQSPRADPWLTLRRAEPALGPRRVRRRAGRPAGQGRATQPRHVGTLGMGPESNSDAILHFTSAAVGSSPARQHIKERTSRMASRLRITGVVLLIVGIVSLGAAGYAYMKVQGGASGAAGLQRRPAGAN